MLGLSPTEYKIYQQIVKLGTADAKDISKHANIAYTAVYPALTFLEEAELIIVHEGSKRTYTAQDPKLALQRLRRERENQLKAEQNKILEEIQTLEKESAPKEDTIAQLLTGRPASVESTLELIDTAQTSIAIMGWRFRSIDSAYTLVRHMRQARERGVRIRLLVDPEIHKEVETLLDVAKINYRKRKTPFVSIFIKDNMTCKLTVNRASNEKRISIVINDSEFCTAQTALFDTLWKKAKKTS